MESYGEYVTNFAEDINKDFLHLNLSFQAICSYYEWDDFFDDFSEGTFYGSPLYINGRTMGLTDPNNCCTK